MNVMILWHMHQPYYVNPLTKRALMPWVRLHAVKGYLDMIDLVSALPELRVNVNFSPVLIRQILELARGEVVDSWEQLSRRPATELHENERAQLIENFFKINWETLVRPVPRYAELLEKRSAHKGETWAEIARRFSGDELRDLQVLFNLQWCGFSALRRFPLLAELREKGRDYTEAEKLLVLDLHHEIVGRVLGEYRAAAERGQIELTTTPYFHPIMPLVYDTNVARRCQPTAPLPSSFSAPDDVRAQLRLAQEQHAAVFGQKARGCWPSEGSICPEIVPLMVEAGLDYFCSDEGNLFKSLAQDPAWNRREVEHRELFQGWRIRSGEAAINALFRDRPLSDFIGFDAARNEPGKAVAHLLEHLKNIALAAPAERAVVSLILDGENAWEAFPDGGEEFLTKFYQALLAAPELTPCRLGDYFDQFPPTVETTTLHSGSWIRSDFDIWIGDPEENRAWEWLKETRLFLVERAPELPADIAELAWWEIYAAEGSDWFWWYGPDFIIDTDLLFDELFRLHLQNVYRLIGIEPPAHLEVPICLPSAPVGYSPPSQLLSPECESANEHFFAWQGAGRLDLTRQATAMFQGDRIGRQLLFGFGREGFYLRFDLTQVPETLVVRFLMPRPVRLTLHPALEEGQNGIELAVSEDGVDFQTIPATGIQVVFGPRLLLMVPNDILGPQSGSLFFFAQVLEKGLQRERYPERGAIELTFPGERFGAEQWLV